MTAQNLSTLERTRGASWGTVGVNIKLWHAAIKEYNEDHPDDKPMTAHCRPCLFKVYAYLNQKYS